MITLMKYRKKRVQTNITVFDNRVTDVVRFRRQFDIGNSLLSQLLSCFLMY